MHHRPHEISAVAVPWCQAASCPALRRDPSGRRDNLPAADTGRQLCAGILECDKHTCPWCGARATTVGHVQPKVVGSSDHPGNLVAALPVV